MIYKFIDNNGSEISVNSLSSLQALVDSETIKENTKVKAGLRGKWTTAAEIEELVFASEKIVEDEKIEEPENDIKSFITETDNTEEILEEEVVQEEKIDEAQKEQIVEKFEEPVEEKKSEAVIQPWQNDKVENAIDDLEETETEDFEEKSEYDQDEEQRDKTYDDENVIGLNFAEAISICFKKYFNFKDRASRSEYWYFQLLVTPIFIWAQFPSNDNQILILQLILVFGLLIPAVAVGVRRFHDKDKSGWWILISLVPYVGSFIILIMLIDKGTEGTNRFGNYPLKLK